VGCSDAGWSAVTSAGANTALAGVLAGFMLNGIVVMLSSQMRDIGKVRALSLLFAAFVALGLDSYLFGMVSGDSSCQRAWTEAMLAAGLLGVGAVAIISGFGLLVAEYVTTADSEPTALLTTLFNWLRAGTALVVLGLLNMTSWNYLSAVLGSHVPGYAKDLLWSYLGIGAAALVILVASTKLPSLTEKLIKLNVWLSERGPQRLVSAAKEISGRLDKPLEIKQKITRAIYASLSYAVVSVLAATLFARTSPRPWDQPDGWAKAAFILTIIWVLVFALAPLFYLLVRCSPPFGDVDAGEDAKPDGDKDPGVPTPASTRHDVLAEQLWGGDVFVVEVTRCG
jgi:hypothetical protein